MAPTEPQHESSGRADGSDERPLSEASLSSIKEEEESDLDDSDDEGGSGRGARSGLLGYLLSLLSRGGDEFVPWLSWKVYDVLFALAIIWLSKRFKLIERARELEVL